MFGSTYQRRKDASKNQHHFPLGCRSAEVEAISSQEQSVKKGYWSRPEAKSPRDLNLWRKETNLKIDSRCIGCATNSTWIISCGIVFGHLHIFQPDIFLTMKTGKMSFQNHSGQGGQMAASDGHSIQESPYFH